MPLIRRLTAPGSSALAVLEVVGMGAAPFLYALGAGRLPAPGGMLLATLDLGQGLREQALLVSTKAGYEIQTHGNPLLVDAILARAPTVAGAAAVGPPAASMGRGMEDRILGIARETSGRHALELALFQLGDLGLLGTLRRLAAGREIDACLRVCRSALDHAALVRRQLAVTRIVLRGRVNAGKSTLFNLLVGQERVRTGPMPALTRDPIEQQILYRDHSLLLVDTAGDADGLVDLDDLAQQQSRQESLRSDLVVWVHNSADQEPGPRPQEGVIIIETHHPRSKLESLELDLLQSEPLEIRAHVLDLFLRTSGIEAKAPLLAAPLDEGMEAEVRWLLAQEDPVPAAGSLLVAYTAEDAKSRE